MVQDRAIVTMAEVIHVPLNRTIFNDLGHFLAISHPTGIDRYLLAQSTNFGSHILYFDCNLFSQLFIAAQVRDINLEEIFSHENHPWPPALSLNGRLRLPGDESILLACIDPSIQPEPPFIMYSADLADKAEEHDVNFHGYADDTQLYVHCRPEETAATSAKLERCIT